MIVHLRRLLFILVVFLVAVVAFSFHLRAVTMLPVDFDEDDYLAAAQRYAAAIKTNDLQAIIEYTYNFEHPPLTKLVYAVVILPLHDTPFLLERPSAQNPQASLPEPHFTLARLSSALFGTLEVVFLAILNPLAGLMLAVSTWQTKYSSQIMLEPLPALTSLLLVLSYIQARRAEGKKRIFWMGASAFWLGISAASKYTYAIAGVAVIVDWIFVSLANNETQKSTPILSRLKMFGADLGDMLAWGMGAIFIFFAVNPRLWHDPIGRLVESLVYHQQFTQSVHVLSTGFPPWQQLIWLFQPVPWHPGVFPIAIDPLLTFLAGIGFWHLWKRQRVMALWLGLAVLMLLVWPTKWPQYLLNLLAPYSLSAAEGLTWLVTLPAPWIIKRVASLRKRTDSKTQQVTL